MKKSYETALLCLIADVFCILSDFIDEWGGEVVVIPTENEEVSE